MATPKQQQAPIPVFVPVDANGNPMAMVSFAAHELVNLGNYSNCTIGPATITVFCENTFEAREATLKEITQQVEDHIANERGLVAAGMGK